MNISNDLYFWLNEYMLLEYSVNHLDRELFIIL